MSNVLQDAQILPFPVEITKSIAGAVNGKHSAMLLYHQKVFGVGSGVLKILISLG
jgi:hypothetical protein